MPQQFFSIADSTRAEAVLRRLVLHKIKGWAVTGGLAVGLHSVAARMEPIGRSLSDLDFVTERFEEIPETLARDFLFRHVHPRQQSGGTMMQLVDVDAQLRIDVFRAVGETFKRASQMTLPVGEVTVVALEDLIARAARLSLDLANGVPVPAKHAADFLLLSTMLGRRDAQSAWCDHRKPNQPESFAEVRKILTELIPNQRNLLVSPEYSKDVHARCERCMPTAAFPLADPRAILSVLGYC
jgi:hypothetical protein